jgi:hypothetical protein
MGGPVQAKPPPCLLRFDFNFLRGPVKAAWQLPVVSGNEHMAARPLFTRALQTRPISGMFPSIFLKIATIE